MANSWTAHYLDGRTAARHRIILTVAPEALHFVLSSGETKQWPYDQIRQTQGAYSGEPVRLERGAESVVISSPALLTAIHETVPTMVQHFHNPSLRKVRLRWTVFAVLGTFLLVLGLYRWGIPGMAAAAIPYVPLAWEEALGREVTEQLAPETRQCHDPDRLRKLNQVVQALTTTRPTSPYHIWMSILDTPAVNAFAAPGGRVVILRGLLEKTDSPEQ
ncbi:MAG: putative Peptidase, family, partial [Nitrospira sp.]|nr:putative Peptidase, family [Nitrospira sp.]